ncbi:DNA polymerase III subunit delta [Companilactobacillus metriopterae]|uniref:DNA polymerase III subunit delta n=1 Tax=Companilactobacillus metriopterae TaxID=1909267 RepID=UPI00100B9AC6|nr:DNA polymerase III subunit delta [Companilactobacillus metriopterae]
MKYSELIKNLNKDNIAPVYFVSGDEEAFIQELQNKFKSLFDPQELEMNFSSFDLENESIEDLLNEAMSAPFFGERRLIFALHPYFVSTQQPKGSIDQNTDSLVSYIDNPSPTTSLVIFADYPKLDSRKKIVKKLKKLSVEVDASKLDSKYLFKQINETLNDDGYSIDNGALQLLLNKTDNNYSNTINQLDKLKLYAIDTKKITEESVKLLVPNNLEENVFDLSNAILKKDVLRADDLLQQFLLQKIDPIFLIAILIGQIRSLLQVKILSERGLTEGTIQKELKLNPYRLKMILQQNREISMERLNKMYSELVDADFQIMTGQNDKEVLLDLFILKNA